MFLVLHRRCLGLGALLLLFLGLFAHVLWRGAAISVFEETGGAAAGPVVVIDPGHGGEDGGAVAEDGTVESQINLAVARRLRELLFLAGVPTRMTRETDISIHEEGAETLREKKVSDIRRRVALINAIPDAVVISIHQNSLPKARSVRGAQVFYNARPGSDRLAAAIQAPLNAAVNGPENEKQAREIDSSVYLMKHAACPAVLVECGFLSNPEEVRQLREEGYQLRLAAVIAAGCLSGRTAEEGREPYP